MANSLPPIPNEAIGETHSWREWLQRVRAVVANPSGTIFHNLLGGLQGGSSSQRVHLTTAQVNVLGGSGSNSPYLTPPASTGAAGTAPIKLTSGTKLSTPESGAIEFQNGHFYVTDGAQHVIDVSDAPIISDTTVTNTTTETTIFTNSLIANELHQDHGVEIDLFGIYSNASAADNFTINVYLDASLIHTISRTGGNVTNAGWFFKYRFTVRTAGASGVYIDWAQFNDSSTNYFAPSTATSSIDTTVAHNIYVKLVWANAKAGNTFTCQQGLIKFHH